MSISGDHNATALSYDLMESTSLTTPPKSIPPMSIRKHTLTVASAVLIGAASATAPAANA